MENLKEKKGIKGDSMNKYEIAFGLTIVIGWIFLIALVLAMYE